MTERPLVKVTTKAPKRCTSAEIGAFEGLVLKGGEVDPHGLSGRISRADVLAFAYVSHELAGVAALKRPTGNYHASVFKKSASPRPRAVFPVELGWVYVLESQRRKGISQKLVDALLKASGQANVFATSRTDNVPMHRVLERAGFVRTGVAYPSGRGKHQLQLFVHTAVQLRAGGTRRGRRVSQLRAWTGRAQIRALRNPERQMRHLLSGGRGGAGGRSPPGRGNASSEAPV